MTLWIGNGAVLISSSQWQLKECWKLNNSVHELFINAIFQDGVNGIYTLLAGSYWDFNIKIQLLFIQMSHTLAKGAKCICVVHDNKTRHHLIMDPSNPFDQTTDLLMT